MATTRTARQASIRTMAQLAILTAILLIFAFTPLGFLKIGPVEITFYSIVVAVGANIGGFKYGTILGLVFGLTSFFTCFGMSPLGVVILGINPVFTFITCVVTRVLMGAVTGIIADAFKKANTNRIIAYSVTSLSAALLNTAFFVGALVLFFGNNATLHEAMSVESLVGVVTLLLTFNALIEAVVCLIAGTAVNKVLDKVVKPLK